LNDHTVCRNNILAQHHIPNFYIIFIKKKNKKKYRKSCGKILNPERSENKIHSNN
jgi:hypothetical protein